MNPEDLSIRDVVAKLRRAAAARQRLCPTARFEGWGYHIVVPYLFALYHRDN